MLRTDGTIAISKFIENQIKSQYSVAPKNLQVIYRGINTKIFNSNNVNSERIEQIKEQYSLESDSIKILLPGRLTEWKGHSVLVQAIAKVIKSVQSKIEVLFVGPDENMGLKKKLKDQIENLNMTNIFHFIGSSDEMTNIYGLSDIVISSSTDPEAFGRIAVEAQSMGKFVIASNHGGSTETIIDNETGYLYSPQDHNELAERIVKSIDQHKYKSSNIREAGLNNVKKNYTVEGMCKETLEFYKKIIV